MSSLQTVFALMKQHLIIPRWKRYPIVLTQFVPFGYFPDPQARPSHVSPPTLSLPYAPPPHEIHVMRLSVGPWCGRGPAERLICGELPSDPGSRGRGLWNREGGGVGLKDLRRFKRRISRVDFSPLVRRVRDCAVLCFHKGHR